jgi:branched-chain amino acid transport system substrate-binding protein
MTTAQGFAGAMSRRTLCRSLLASWSLPLVVPLAACGGGALMSRPGSGVGGRNAALLLPLSGSQSAVGQNMARAATLVTRGLDPAAAPAVLDTGDTAEGAAAAAREAIAGGAQMLMGPLRGDQTPAVLAVAGRVPVVTFSNDDKLVAQGAFVMGVTPAQSVATMFSYARAQGLTRIAVVARESPLGAASIAAARGIAQAGGISLTATLLRDPAAEGLLGAIRSASGGTLPQAVYLPDGGGTLTAFAQSLQGSGLQVLGSVQWGVADAAADPNLSGAWFAAAPPDLFQPFSDQFQASFGEAPGIIAALGHDAALIAVGMGNAGELNRKGLLRKAGFTGVLGNFRFLEDGRCQRDLTVLGIRGGGIESLAEIAGA